MNQKFTFENCITQANQDYSFEDKIVKKSTLPLI